MANMAATATGGRFCAMKLVGAIVTTVTLLQAFESKEFFARNGCVMVGGTARPLHPCHKPGAAASVPVQATVPPPDPQ
jgi:hypothetical protein